MQRITLATGLVLAATSAAAAGYTRVCNSGEAAGSGACPAAPRPGPGVNDWGCTRDEASGLVWELKTSTGDLRDRDKTYTNFSAAYNPNRELGAALDANGYAKAVNDAGLCGRRDWRLPTRSELIGLVRPGAPPAIDAASFPDLPAKKHVFWSGSAFAGAASNAWGVDFTDGVAGDDNRNIYYAVRLVSGAGRAIDRSASAGGQEIDDRGSRLVWRRCAEGMQWSSGSCTGTPVRDSYEAAEVRAKSEAQASKLAWRLPTMHELASITDDGRSGPAIDPALFPGTPALPFWTSTPSAEHRAYMWTVHFGPGHAGHHGYRSDRFAVRLVRDGR